jgi:cold shock CspA family protein
MRKDGTVVRWDSARGFGFIRSAGTPADVFFHAKDFQNMAAPHEGMPVTFEEIHVGGKGPRAMSVKSLEAMRASGIDRSSRPAMRQPRKSPGASALRHSASGHRHASSRRVPAAFAMLLMLGWMALVLWGVWVGRLPALALALAPLLNLLTFWMYWSDKHAAQTGSWRTKEDTLTSWVCWAAGQAPGLRSRSSGINQTRRLFVAAIGRPWCCIAWYLQAGSSGRRFGACYLINSRLPTIYLGYSLYFTNRPSRSHA